MKKTISSLLLLPLLLILGSCKSGSKGYSDLDTLYADFVTNLKAGDNALKQYCYQITPDAGTIRYMKKKGFSYRGLPEGLEERGLEVTVIGDKYYEMAKEFREELVQDKQLDDLKYIGREEPGEELVDKRLGIYGTETFILLRSGNDTIRCKLGEMFKIDGKWKSFTSPKLGW